MADCGGKWVAAQKLPTASGRGNQPAGVTPSPTAVARAPEFKSLRRGPTSPTEYLRPRESSASYLGDFQRGVVHQERKRQGEHCH